MFVFLVKDEATGYRLTSKARKSWKGVSVRKFDRLVIIHGLPKAIRSDNGDQYISHAVVGWALDKKITQGFIVPGMPWQNGAAESLVATLRRERPDVELFSTLEMAQIQLSDGGVSTTKSAPIAGQEESLRLGLMWRSRWPQREGRS